MSRQRRLPGATDRAVLTFKGGALDKLKDASSAELAKMAKTLGNDELQGLLAQGQQKRDALLAFIQERLQQLMLMQQKERAEMKNRPEWRRQLAMGVTGFGLPDPTRWRGAALAYRRATEALCQGNLGRAAELLDKAVEAERLAWLSRPQQMNEPERTSMPTSTPDERAFISDGEGAPPTSAPALFQLVDRIVRVTDTMNEVPMERPEAKHRWWEAEEEEQEEEKKEKKAKESGRAATGSGAPAVERQEEARAPAQAEERREERGVTPPAPEKERSGKTAPEKDAPEKTALEKTVLERTAVERTALEKTAPEKTGRRKGGR